MVLWLKSISIFNIDENIRYFITIELTFTLHLLKGGVGGLYGPKILALPEKEIFSSILNIDMLFNQRTI